MPRDLLILLALCPAIGVADTLANAIGLGAAALVVAVAANLIVFSVTRWVPEDVRFPVIFIVLAAVVAGVEMLMNAWLHELWESLAVFLPLLAVSIMLALSANASTEAITALSSGARLGGLIAAVLIVLGTVRELVGRGSLLHDVAHLLGSGTREINLFRVDMGFLLAMLTPGAFISLGLLIALRNWLAQRRSA